MTQNHHPDQPVSLLSERAEANARIAELVRRATTGEAPPPPAAPVPSATHPAVGSGVQSRAAARVAARSASGPAGRSATPARPGSRVRTQTRAGAAPADLLTRLRGIPQHWLIGAAGALAALLLLWGVTSVAGNGDEGQAPAVAQPSKAAAPHGYVVRATDTIEDCAGSSRSRTQDFFEREDCVTATRILATGTVEGRQVMFVVSDITMETPKAAAGLKSVIDGRGTGNLNDLLREGVTFEGAPKEMPSSGYASVQTGARLVVSEAGFIDGGQSENRDPALRAAAADIAAHVHGQATAAAG